ncbi:MFS transporter [Streptomyces sp. NPDC048224]|uniref:MFS transporter n=1 Tax=unclassified Streptomyces TaxID=2593676 RepID=UPI00340EB2C8
MRTETGGQGAATGRDAGIPGSFRVLWVASTLSTLGDGIRTVAFPLLAAGITKDPQAVSFIFVAGYLPWPLFGLVGGAIVDRTDRRRLMWTTDLVRGVLIGGFAVLVSAQESPVLLLALVSFSLGVAETLFDNAASAMVPMLVRGPALERANAWLFSSQTVMTTLLGAPVGAALFAVSHALPIAVDAVTFILAALLVFFLKGTYRVRVPTARTSLRQDIGEGLRWLLRHRLLRTLCVLVGLTNAALAAAEAVLVLYTLDVLGVGNLGYSLLLAVLAVGGVVGSALASTVRRRLSTGTVLIGAMLAQAVAFAAPGVFPNVPVVVIALALAGAGGGVWNVVTVSLRQSLVPAEMLGRVTSGYRTVAFSAMPVGAALGGFTADHFGLRSPFVISGALLLVATVLCRPRMRAMTLEVERKEASE